MPQTLSDHVAREVRAELGRRRTSISALAQHLGISRQMVSARLNGHIEFRTSEIESVAEFFGVPVTQFLPTAEQVPS